LTIDHTQFMLTQLLMEIVGS